jgi:hypothetical protein
MWWVGFPLHRLLFSEASGKKQHGGWVSRCVVWFCGGSGGIRGRNDVAGGFPATSFVRLPGCAGGSIRDARRWGGKRTENGGSVWDAHCPCCVGTMERNPLAHWGVNEGEMGGTACWMHTAPLCQGLPPPCRSSCLLAPFPIPLAPPHSFLLILVPTSLEEGRGSRGDMLVAVR